MNDWGSRRLETSLHSRVVFPNLMLNIIKSQGKQKQNILMVL